MIYFIRQGDDGPIKIGFADDVKKRFSQLQTANPYSLKLLLKHEGDEKVEEAFHIEFYKNRLRGEWYEPCENLLKYIELSKKCLKHWPEEFYDYIKAISGLTEVRGISKIPLMIIEKNENPKRVLYDFQKKVSPKTGGCTKDISDKIIDAIKILEKIRNSDT